MYLMSAVPGMTGCPPRQLGGPTVKRRFRHFVWLHERLCERYPFILMPLVPDKQVQGRFEAAFIERRRKQLERYMNRIALHPVLRSSPIVMQFLKATDLPVRTRLCVGIGCGALTVMGSCVSFVGTHAGGAVQGRGAGRCRGAPKGYGRQLPGPAAGHRGPATGAEQVRTTRARLPPSA